MLLLNLNRIAYKESPITSSHLTLIDLESQSQGHWNVKTLYLIRELGHMLLLNIKKPYMGSPVTIQSLSHLTLIDLKRSKLRYRIWSKIDTCIVRYCVRVNPDFNWFSVHQWVIFDTSLQKIDNVIPNAAVKQSAKVLGPLITVVHCCWGLRTLSGKWLFLFSCGH